MRIMKYIEVYIPSLVEEPCVSSEGTQGISYPLVSQIQISKLGMGESLVTNSSSHEYEDLSSDLQNSCVKKCG